MRGFARNIYGEKILRIFMPSNSVCAHFEPEVSKMCSTNSFDAHKYSYKCSQHKIFPCKCSVGWFLTHPPVYAKKPLLKPVYRVPDFGNSFSFSTNLSSGTMDGLFMPVKRMVEHIFETSGSKWAQTEFVGEKYYCKFSRYGNFLLCLSVFSLQQSHKR